MGDKTGISWTDATWNPTKGCSRVSAGCQNCYAEVQAARIVRMGKGKPTAYDDLVRVTAGGDARWTGKVTLDAKTLALPLRWSKPRRIFVNSMSDLFHESLTNEQIAAVFGVMAAAPQHTFQVLTKRATRMREWFEWMTLEENFSPNATMHVEACELDAIGEDEDDVIAERILDAEWPLSNVWLGVSVEDQHAADERIPELLDTPAAVRFLSCEPLLGEVSIPSYLRGTAQHAAIARYAGKTDEPGVDWVIAGCESGPGARPCSVKWLQFLRDQCAFARVPFFLKQATQPGSEAVGGPLVTPGIGSKHKAGGVIELPYLDGIQHAAFPEVRYG